MIRVETHRGGPGKRGKKRGRDEGNVGGRRGTVRRKASRGVSVKGDKVRRVKGSRDRTAAGVRKRRKPAEIVRVEVAEDD